MPEVRTTKEALKQDTQAAIWKIDSALEALKDNPTITNHLTAGRLMAAATILSQVHQDA